MWKFVRSAIHSIRDSRRLLWLADVSTSSTESMVSIQTNKQTKDWVEVGRSQPILRYENGFALYQVRCPFGESVQRSNCV